MTMVQVASEPALVDTENPVATLSTQWYHVVVRQLGLSSKTFALQQPFIPLPLTTPGIWSLFNVLPPTSVVINLMAGNANRFYPDYCAVVNQLVPRVPNNMKEILGDDLAAWNAYVKALKPMPRPAELGEVFFGWALIHCPGKASAGRAEFNSLISDPIDAAVIAMTDKSGFAGGVPTFGIALDDARTVIRDSPGASIHFDSAKESSDVSTTWAPGSASGGGANVGCFLTGRDGDASWRRINEKASQSQVLVEVSFDNIATVQGPPGGWFSPAALSLAYRGRNDDGMWRNGGPDWEGTFGVGGNLQRVVGSLVLVDGIKVKMTSTAQYSQEEQLHIEESFGGGIWPFTGVAGHGGRTSKVKFDRDGAAVFTTSCAPGNIWVFGANVVPVSALLGVDAI